MQPNGHLMRMEDKLTTYIAKYVKLAGTENRDEVVDLFEKIQFLFPQWVIITCPFMHPDFSYVSKNYTQIFPGQNQQSINHSIAQFFNFVHEADHAYLQDCFDHVYDHLESIDPELHFQYRQVFHYRLQKNHLQYIYVHDEKAVLNLKDAGNLYYALLKDITYEKAFTGVKVELFKHDHTISKISQYKPALENNALSKREGELVTLIKQGLSTKEIAWNLNISHNTVRNIKSKLFEKFNVNNTIELLNMTA